MCRKSAFTSMELLVIVAVVGGLLGLLVPTVQRVRSTTNRLQARAALRTALEAWKQGERPESLRDGAPSIHMTDDDWQAGRRLKRYQVDDADEVVGVGLRCNVVLAFEDESGGKVERRALYHIDVQPRLVIARADRSRP
jgi:hypothetical protein